ncbi:hypothetical protein [Wenxinia marina]|uniref:Gamma-glutamyl kinase n=1 Tax=Wenxinia marina DSM 24838 TaxID=1123501 RepID=A0A0D0Q5K9_9RHOB|nr:hypothetical protein [Wenxinia marina]KIQ69754.1 hypothetical protein Wenmar_01324 [Wenxinia marina DSM 24838]GGL60891.1 gamma-glutamyl kinase [Wenxinia marina]
MLVFWKESLVLFAVPKTGTTALEGHLAPRAALVLRDPPIVKHTPVYRYRRFLAPYLALAGDKVFDTVAAVRHPVDWLGSWYRYRHRDDLVGHPNSTRGVTFDRFVAEYARGKPAPYAAVGSQARFLRGQEAAIGVTHLFRYEAHDKLVAFLEERLGTRIALDRLNVSPDMPLDLAPSTEARLREKRPEEFAAYEAGVA